MITIKQALIEDLAGNQMTVRDILWNGDIQSWIDDTASSGLQVLNYQLADSGGLTPAPPATPGTPGPGGLVVDDTGTIVDPNTGRPPELVTVDDNGNVVSLQPAAELSPLVLVGVGVFALVVLPKLFRR